MAENKELKKEVVEAKEATPTLSADAAVQTPVNNFESEIKENKQDLKKANVVKQEIPKAKPVYRETKRELARDKAPKYMFWYSIDGLTGAMVIDHLEKFSPIDMISLTMDGLFDVVERGFNAYWKHSAYIGTYWFNRPITKDNIKEFAFFINEEVKERRLKLSELDKGTEYYG